MSKERDDFIAILITALIPLLAIFGLCIFFLFG